MIAEVDKNIETIFNKIVLVHLIILSCLNYLYINFHSNLIKLYRTNIDCLKADQFTDTYRGTTSFPTTMDVMNDLVSCTQASLQYNNHNVELITFRNANGLYFEFSCFQITG